MTDEEEAKLLQKAEMSETHPLRLTQEEIDAGRSPRGQWTRKQLAKWGVPWPPPAGWKAALLAGEPIPIQNAPAAKPKAESEPDPRCQTCHFWEFVMYDKGHCHRFPPLPATNGGEAHWPVMYGPVDWCGEYRPRRG